MVSAQHDAERGGPISIDKKDGPEWATTPIQVDLALKKGVSKNQGFK